MSDHTTVELVVARQHTDDGVACVQSQIASQDAGVAAKARLPDPVAQHCHAIFARQVLAICEGTAPTTVERQRCRSTAR